MKLNPTWRIIMNHQQRVTSLLNTPVVSKRELNYMKWRRDVISCNSGKSYEDEFVGFTSYEFVSYDVYRFKQRGNKFRTVYSMYQIRDMLYKEVQMQNLREPELSPGLDELCSNLMDVLQTSVFAYTSIGTPLDYDLGVDFFIVIDKTEVITIDVTTKPFKDNYHADYLWTKDNFVMSNGKEIDEISTIFHNKSYRYSL